jgi:hypothetical protein
VRGSGKQFHAGEMDFVVVAAVVDVPEDNEVTNCGHKGIEEETAKDDNHKVLFPSLKFVCIRNVFKLKKAFLENLDTSISFISEFPVFGRAKYSLLNFLL